MEPGKSPEAANNGEEMASNKAKPAKMEEESNGEESSPRDKKQKIDGSPRPSSSPGASPRGNTSSPSNFMVAASPPKFVSFEEIMKAASGVQNMTLAHEITVDDDFCIEPEKLPENSLEKQVKEIMHKAFWDALEESLKEPPYDYEHALKLMQELKENLLDLLLPQHQRFRTQISEVLDMELIEQKADHGALDFQYYADFVISIMAQLCAPARDDQIASLREIKGVVPLFKEIFAVIDLMKMDMANFNIQQIRPYLQRQAQDYEKQKFQDFLKAQDESGVDGLQFTKAWITRNAAELASQLPAHSQEGATASASSSSMPPGVTPVAILNQAYMELLQWDQDMTYPETIVMDQQRFQDLQGKMEWLSLVSAILLVTYNTVGAPIAGIKGLKESLKSDIAVILNGVHIDELKSAIKNVSEHVNKTINKVLEDHDFPKAADHKQTLLKGQIENVADEDHPVHKLMRRRILDFLKQMISSPQTRDIRVPPGFSAISDELSHVCGRFLRLISHNRSVFGLFYADIISTWLKNYNSSNGGNGDSLGTAEEAPS